MILPMQIEEAMADGIQLPMVRSQHFQEGLLRGDRVLQVASFLKAKRHFAQAANRSPS